MTDTTSDPPSNGVITFPVPRAGVPAPLDDLTTQLLETLFAGYQNAVAIYQREPTLESWSELKRSYKCWLVAFDAECDGCKKS